MNTTLNISPAPHARDRWTTRFIMGVVALALLPTAVIGVLAYGLRAFWVILASVGTAVLTEFIFDKIAHKPDTWLDGSAVVTGLMLALTLSPSVPLYIPVIGSVFAIFIVKCCFGGLGKNFVNPALAARCFLLISFGKTMTMFTVDGVTAATPIGDLMAGRAVNITEMFLGTANGVIGSSAIALLAGGLVLWAMDIIHGEICFSVIGGFTLLIGLFGGQGFDPRFLAANLCGGGVIMGAFFMATDYVTSPVSRLGQLIYGLTIGVLGALFRIFGSSADSFSYSIIIGNLLVPLIDTYIIPKPFAYRKGAQNRERRKFRIPKPVVAIGIITLLAGAALSGVFTLTKDTIEEQKLAANTESYKAVCPDAVSFEPSEAAKSFIEELDGGVYGSGFGKVYINGAVVGRGADGSVVGYVISVTTAEGNDGNITLSVGISADGVVNGIAFTELNETPGMGMRCGEPEFMSQFEGKEVSKFTLVKSGAASDGEIDAITGATVTSKAVVNAVNAGVDFYANVLKGGN